VQVFLIYRGSFHRAASIGDFVRGAVKTVAFYPRHFRGRRYRPLRVGYVVRGMVSQTRAPGRFLDNTRLGFLANALVVLRRRGLFKTKQLPGPQARTLRRRQYEALFDAYV